ncbi:LOW QUALITY PROTEIN: coiled-coil domain-containing protein 183 [Suncus etruscus]|uniref:LOW QUALITY PROTEIN: coiled-coil domain-containing protein 183 n=1 Tax=Suncus etruscus TaxID=109475 RepID=UPI0021109C01|nr:LOW QUALITY PROTEIN: coiled-coil domain-containing protein 183 [Suncus etruscus]
MEANKASSLDEQIQELRTITRLQEQCQALQLQSLRENTEKNMGTLAQLHQDIRRGKQEWALAQKSDQQIISKACQKDVPLKLALCHSTIDVVQEKLCKYVLDRVNVHNVLLHLARRRRLTLESLQQELVAVQGQAVASKEAQEQLQVIRQLENNIEKKMVLITATKNIHSLYEHLREHLKKMLYRYPTLLDKMQSKVNDYCLELAHMKTLSHDAVKITDHVKKNLKNVETTFLEERRGREQLLSQQKKLIDRIRSKDTGYRHQVSPGVLKWVFQRALLTAQSLPRTRRTDTPLTYKKRSYGVSACLLHPGQGTGEDGSPLSGPFPLSCSTAEIALVGAQQYQDIVRSLVEQVKSSVQCSHLWDITSRFTAQKNTEENLEVQILECGKKQAELQKQMQQLKLEENALKFHQVPDLVSFKSIEGRIQEMLRDEQERRRVAYASMVKGQQMLLTVEMGIDNLYLQLKGATLPVAIQKRGPGAPLWERAPAQFQKVALPTKPLDLFDKLASCEEQLLQLASRTQKLTWTEEIDEKVRDALESSVTREKLNYRIHFKDFEDDEDMIETFQFSDMEQSYVPSRSEIKNQVQVLRQRGFKRKK